MTNPDCGYNLINNGHLVIPSAWESYYDNKTVYQSLNDTCKKYKTDRQSIKTISHDGQLERDETFWTASVFINLFESGEQTSILERLLRGTYGDVPPFSDKSLGTWKECLETSNGDKLELILEAELPAPYDYRKVLEQNIYHRQIIPYIVQLSQCPEIRARKSNYEGSTHVDAIIHNPSNKFTIYIEAKVLSDIAPDITYDVARNQIARNIDVMLCSENNAGKEFGRIGRKFQYNHNIKDRSLFMLLTPEIFFDNWRSRLYGYKMHDYWNQPNTLAHDLKHRKDITDWNSVSRRLGWATWERVINIGKGKNIYDRNNLFILNFPELIEACRNCL